MGSHAQGVEMGFTGERFPENTHLCLIFDNEEQRREIVSKYVSTGLRLRERVRYFADTHSPGDVQAWLLSMGVDLPESPADDRCKFLQAVLAFWMTRPVRGLLFLNRGAGGCCWAVIGSSTQADTRAGGWMPSGKQTALAIRTPVPIGRSIFVFDESDLKVYSPISPAGRRQPKLSRLVVELSAGRQIGDH